MGISLEKNLRDKYKYLQFRTKMTVLPKYLAFQIDDVNEARW